ncbi:MAG: heterocyst frequency control protein PatD [Geitlerinemataceae cyanobacterium]
MLPNDRQQRYRKLRESLEQLCLQVGVDRPDAVSLRESVDRVQEFFGSQLLHLPAEGLDPADVSRTQSYNTELHKQLRLLATDVLFLGSARQAATVQQRQGQLRDRLMILLRYCDILLGEDSSPA